MRQPNKNLLLRFYGLRRSGNHPVGDWLRKNLPYTDLTERHHNDVWVPDLDQPRLLQSQDLRTEVPQTGRGLLLVSYEDVPLSQIPQVSITNSEDVLPDAEMRDVLLLRDPFNFAASRLQSRIKHGENFLISRVPLATAMAQWKEYAREFIRIGDGQPGVLKNAIPINYNSWNLYKAYRDQLLRAEFGVKVNNDYGIDDVSRWGRGSSFDGVDYHGKGSQMHTDKRWELFAAEPEFREIFKDREIIDLSKDIFGDISGTERLWTPDIETQITRPRMERR